MRPFLGLALIELSALALLGWGRPEFPLPAIALFGVAFVSYALAAMLSHRRRGRETETDSRWVPGVWTVAVLLRLSLLPLEPRLSDDVYRYLWDGHVQLAGVNPYLHTPADLAVSHLRTPWHALINNPDIPTIYPPLAQMVFLLIGLLGATVGVAKALWLIFDLAAGWCLMRLAKDSGRSVVTVGVLYLWSPLLVVETAWSAHFDAMGIFAVALALLWAQQGASLLAGGALALSALSKFAPLAAAPAMWRRYGWRFLLGLVFTLGIGYAPYAGAGRRLWTGLSTYAEHWRFNEGAFWFLESLTPDPLLARSIAAALVLAIVCWTIWRRLAAEDALFWILGTGLLFSPTVHPWYVLWMLPFAALRGNLAWLYLSGAVFLAYFGLDSFHESGQWPQPLVARLLIWLPFFALLIGHALAQRRRRTPQLEPLSQAQPEVTR